MSKKTSRDFNFKEGPKCRNCGHTRFSHIKAASFIYSGNPVYICPTSIYLADV